MPHVFNFTTTKYLGGGGNGEVWSGFGYIVGMSPIEITVKHAYPNSIPDFEMEVAALRKMSSKSVPLNVPRFFGSVVSPVEHTVIMDLQEGTDLHKFISDSSSGTRRAAFNHIAAQLVSTILWMNDAGVAHLDLSWGNVMYSTKTKTVSVIDFGQSALDTGLVPTKDAYGTMGFSCPLRVELLTIHARPSFDVHAYCALWSAGAVLYSLFYTRPPVQRLYPGESTDMGKLYQTMQLPLELEFDENPTPEQAELLRSLLYNVYKALGDEVDDFLRNPTAASDSTRQLWENRPSANRGFLDRFMDSTNNHVTPVFRTVPAGEMEAEKLDNDDEPIARYHVNLDMGTAVRV